MSKKLIFTCLAMAGAALAEGEHTLEYNLPESGLAPSYGEISLFTTMHERHGGSSLSMQSYALTIPLSDPRKTHWNDISINAQLDTKITVFNTGGDLTLNNEVMYNVALPISFIKPMPHGNKLIVGIAPEIATDGEAIAHGTDLAAYAMYTVKQSDTFSYTFGLGISPRFAENYAVPFVGFEWKPSTDWTVTMKGYKLTALYEVNDRLHVGPFAMSTGGIWAVDTDHGDENFRMRSLVLGLTGEYNFAEPGQTKRIITFSLGSNVATRADFLKRNADKDSVQTHHYKPALYFSIGVDFRF
ncbi:MAG: hypothetical protein E7031_07970 [Akkermansiaceae bacterium]|nr:hypothetical protein [Akkermansiaceae bacterium]